MRRRDVLAATVGAIAATALAGGLAWAAIPGDGGVIQGCYDSGGNLKVVAAPPCPKGYTPLAWNQTGPQGPPGVQGPQGQPGADGADGQDGVSVTSADEPPGPNCASGGSEFTAAGGTTYACNGRDGNDGRDGTSGADGVAGRELVEQTFSVLPGTNALVRVFCPAGKNVLGGGASASLPAAFGLADVSQSYPFVDAGAEGWAAALHNGSDPGEQPHPVGFRIYAICATAG